MNGESETAELAGFLVALRMKGETVEEITAAAKVMRVLAKSVSIAQAPHLVDTCGTGGDGAKLFNISTAAMFVVAAAGGIVAKHGNRSNSSSSGSADVLEALGVNLNHPPQHIEQSIKKTGLGFMFAPAHHSAMKHVIATRRALKVRTIFNILGPLTNPAGAQNQLIGVFSQAWQRKIAEALSKLGGHHAIVVHGNDGLDEITLAGHTHVVELYQGEISEYDIRPEDFGIKSQTLNECIVDSPEASKTKILEALDNHDSPARDIVTLNAGAAIYAANLTPDLATGIEQAKSLIASGRAKEKLQQFIEFNQ